MRRCRKKIAIVLPMLHGEQKILLPMQHGDAKTAFCDTSRARTSNLQMMKFWLLWIFVESGVVKFDPRWAFVGKVEN